MALRVQLTTLPAENPNTRHERITRTSDRVRRYMAQKAVLRISISIFVMEWFSSPEWQKSSLPGTVQRAAMPAEPPLDRSKRHLPARFASDSFLRASGGRFARLRLHSVHPRSALPR